MKTLLLALLLSPPALHPEADLVRWVPESEAVELARKNSKPILYDLTAAWCPPCRLQEKQVFNDPEHAAWINKSLIPVRVVDRMREDRQNPMRIQQLQQKYKLKGFPTLVVDMPSKSFFGNSKWKSKIGYKNPGDTMQFLRDSIDTLILGELGGGKKPEAGPAVASGWILAGGWGKPAEGHAYNLYMTASSGLSYRKMNSQPIREKNFLIENLEAGKTYYFILTTVVQANGKLEESKPSQEWKSIANAGASPK